MLPETIALALASLVPARVPVWELVPDAAAVVAPPDEYRERWLACWYWPLLARVRHCQYSCLGHTLYAHSTENAPKMISQGKIFFKTKNQKVDFKITMNKLNHPLSGVDQHD